ERMNTFMYLKGIKSCWISCPTSAINMATCCKWRPGVSGFWRQGPLLWSRRNALLLFAAPAKQAVNSAAATATQEATKAVTAPAKQAVSSATATVTQEATKAVAAPAKQAVSAASHTAGESIADAARAAEAKARAKAEAEMEALLK
ncbi:hypothetical protein ACSZM7_18995, partial [Aeromonas veronii]